MRTTIIPAQVTTVEDTIAGNLNLTQILLLISSLFSNTAIYALLPTRLSFSPYKVVFMSIIFSICIILSLRIKNRVIFDWLRVLGTFVFRPHLYLFDKQIDSSRQIVEEQPKTTQKISAKYIAPEERKAERAVPLFDYQSLIRNPALNIRFKRHSIQVVKNYD